jgi:hypothetical protein
MQDPHGQQRHPDHSHRVPDPADRLADPQQPEIPLPQHPADPARCACLIASGGRHSVILSRVRYRRCAVQTVVPCNQSLYD